MSAEERALLPVAQVEDSIVATGEKLNWLIAQLLAWPMRVDEMRTTNQRFLMRSAARTLEDRIAAETAAYERGLRDAAEWLEALSRTYRAGNDPVLADVLDLAAAAILSLKDTPK